MDGPKHYHEAERLIGLAQQAPDETPTVKIALLVQYAQAHATLAVAAATAINAPMPNRATPAEVDAWRQAAGEATPKGVPS